MAASSAGLLFLRAVLGPFEFILPVHNPLNIECAVALSILALLLVSRGSQEARDNMPPRNAGPMTIVAVAAAIAYLPILSMPLITDDYIHLRQIGAGQAQTTVELLTNARGGPQFFRPIGLSIFEAEWRLWGTAAFPRHAFDLVLHAALSVLFLLLARRLGIPPPYDWLAGLLFALNGIGPESVAWPAARFDALALMFSLVAALAVLRGTGWGLPVSLAATAAACLSKESAFVLPVLLFLLAGRSIRTRAGKVLVISNFAVAIAVFAWRWVVLKGIGGYVDQAGAPMAFHFDAMKLAKTFLSRIWGVLWFPVNWSRPLEVWMIVGLAAGAAGSLMLMRARPDRIRLWLCVIAVAVACLPAHHMLLIGPSLERSRYLTYASPAFVLLLAVACRGLPRLSGIIALSLLVVFHLAALEHNLRIWGSVAAARYELCRGIAANARNTDGVLTIGALPLTVDGVYWRNGLEDCLFLEFGIPMSKVRVDTVP